MKLPFQLGTKLIFRLIFPGAIFAAAAAPAIHGALHALGIWIKAEYLLPFEALVWGWAFFLCDMHIYMLFEGRRYWPALIRKALVRLQEHRLRQLKELVDAYPNVDRRRYLEASVDYGLYPVDEDGETYVAQPTRLGNIIEAFESYPKVKYGLDAVFYWYRLWVVLDKDLREEIDIAQAVVDSSVYVSYVLYLSGIVMFLYAGIGFAHYVNWPYFQWLSGVRLPYVPEPRVLCIVGLTCFVVGYLVYRVSLPAHAKFGELFKSIFDQYRFKLEFVDRVLKELDIIIGGPSLSPTTDQERNQMVWRYLRWHRIRDVAAKRNYTVREWKERSLALVCKPRS